MDPLRYGRPPLRGGGAGISWVDVKLGFRMLRKYPVLTGVSILPVALVVATAGAVSTVAGNALHPRLGLDGGDRIVTLTNRNVATGTPDQRMLHDLVGWRGRLKSVRDLGAYETYQPHLVVGGEEPRSVYGSRISPSAFRVARVPPLLGRVLVEDDDRPGAPNVAVVGYDLWESRFGRDPGVIGRDVRLDGAPYTVVGVMPERFRFPFNDQIWVPLRDDKAHWEPLGGPAVSVFGRLSDGLDLREAQAELTVLSRRAASTFPEAYGSLRTRVVRYGTDFWGGSDYLFTGLQLVLGLLLLVICATVGTLVFVRNLSRDAEVAMRFFLGATRARIVAQLFTESLVMTALASSLGLLLASWGLRWAFGVAASSRGGEGGLPFWFRPDLTPGTLLFVAILTLVSATVSGLLPAFSLTGLRSRSSLRRYLASGGATLGTGPKATLIVAGQTAVTVSLLTMVAGLWPKEKDAVLVRVLAGATGLARRLSADPRVEAVTVASLLPGQRHHPHSFEVEDPVEHRDDPKTRIAWVDTAYFDVLHIPVVRGRTFRPADVPIDGSEGRVAVVTRAFASRWFGDRSPLGERVRVVGPLTLYPGDPATHPWAEIVGVVDDIGMSLGDPRHPGGIYLPLNTGTYPLRMAVRTRGDPGQVGGRLRTLSAAVDP